jgi:hypothetical protein
MLRKRLHRVTKSDIQSNLLNKAFLRRALAHKEMSNYQQALSDVEEALKLDNDVAAQTLKGEIE